MIALIYDPQAEEHVRAQIAPLFAPPTERKNAEAEADPDADADPDRPEAEDQNAAAEEKHEPLTLIAFQRDDLPQLEAGTTVITWLSDADLKHLLPIAAANDWRIGLLPHPEMRHARIGFGIASKLDDAVSDICSRRDETHVDLLSCNDEIVLNSVIVGDPFAGTPGTATTESWWKRLIRIGRLFRALRTAIPTRFSLSTSKGKELETVALGIIVVEHGRSAVLSRRVIEDSAPNDGMLHALIYAPDSGLAMLWFLLRSMFLPRLRTAGPLPKFVGHIKTEALLIESPEPVAVSIDGQSVSAARLDLSVERGSLMLIPGRHLRIEPAPPEVKEGFRVQGLPSEDVLEVLRGRPLPLVHRASPEEFKELFQLLRDSARTSESYVVLMVLSTLLATFGLFADSAPVIIGAMILAPLMSPIVAMAMGVLRRNEQGLLRESTKTFALGVIVALVCTVLVTWLTPLQTINSQIAARLNPTLLDMGIAVASGIAGAYAHSRAGVARSLAGVAIAVALVPPLAVAGIGLGWGDVHVFWGAGLLFVTNFVGMILAAAATFLVLGFSPFNFSKRGLTGSLLAVAIVTLLLVPSFVRMVQEHQIIGTLDGLIIAGIEVSDVRIQHGTPLRLSVRLVADGPIDLEAMDFIKHEISDLLEREITLEANVAVRR